MMRSSVSAALFACSVARHRWPGAGERQRVLHRLTVADFTDQDHVRRGAHGAAQRAMERLGVEPHFALVDDRLLVPVQELDRVLDRQDVVGRGLVAVVEHRRERGRLARARGADHQHQAALDHDQVFHDHRQAEFLERGHVGRDVAQHHRGVAALMEDRDAEAAEARLGDREVDLELLLEVIDLFLVHQAVGGLPHLVGGQHLLVDRDDLALDLDLDRRVRAEEQVGRLLLDHQLEQRLGVQHEAAGRVDADQAGVVQQPLLRR